MAACYECGEGTDGIMSVDKWTVEGRRVRVPVCQEHFVCNTCGNEMEVNPISLHVECFVHGPTEGWGPIRIIIHPEEEEG